MNTLGGNVCIRNGRDLDYCWVQAVKSLLPVCDEVIICDCDSSDGTWEEITAWAKKEHKISFMRYPWTNPIGDTTWYPEWINFSRRHLSTNMHIHLDADEVLHEDDYPLIEQARDQGSPRFCKRLNFWRDPKHLIPEGVCCGTKVLRIAPTDMNIPSDYPWGPAAETQAKATDSQIRVFHYGFLRQRDAFFRKAKEVQRIWVNGYDKRLDDADKAGGNWMTHKGVTGWENELQGYCGTHPRIIKDWLTERGYGH